MPDTPHVHGRRFGVAYRRALVPSQGRIALEIMEETASTVYWLDPGVATQLLALLQSALREAAADLAVLNGVRQP